MAIDRYYPIPRPAEADYVGREKDGRQKKPRWITFVSTRPEPILPIKVAAFSYEYGYGAKSIAPPVEAPVVQIPPIIPYNLAKYPEPPKAEKVRWKIETHRNPPDTYGVQAIDILQVLLGTRYVPAAYADRYPPSVRKILAHEPLQALLGPRALKAYADLYPAQVKRIIAHTPDELPPRNTKRVLGYADLRPPIVNRVSAFDYLQGYGARILYPPYPPVVVENVPPETHRIEAIEILQALLGPRVVRAYADLYPPSVERVSAIDIAQILLGTRAVRPAALDFAPPFVEKVQAVDILQALLGTRWITAYADVIVEPTPPGVQRILAFELAQKLLGTRAYPYPPDRYPPAVYKTAAFELAQKLLETRTYFYPADRYPPSVQQVKAVDILQVLLGPRAIRTYADLYPPFVERVMAFDYPQAYGGRRVYPVPADILSPQGVPPEIHRVAAIELVQALFASKAIAAFKDRVPPSVRSVVAFELAQNLLKSRIYPSLRFADRVPPETHKAEAIELLHRLLGTRAIRAYADLHPPEIHRVTAHSPAPPDNPHFYVIVADFVPAPDAIISRVQAHDPVQKRTVPAAYVIRADLRPPGVTKSTAIERVEARLGVRFKHFDAIQVSATFLTPYEALETITTSIESPYEARGFVTSDFALSYEALQELTLTGTIPLEALAGLVLTGVVPWESASQLVPPHILRAAMSSHYYARLLRHYEAHMSTHLATELKKL